jgi:hypothetical protein
MGSQTDRTFLAIGVMHEVDVVQHQAELANDQHYD